MISRILVEPARAPDSGKPRLAYFVNLFPNLIETMIYREVGALRSMGYEIVTFSLRRPVRQQVSPEAWQYMEATHYILPMSPRHFVRAHVRAMMRWPLRYWSTLLRCVTGTHGRSRHRLRTVAHFAQAIAILEAVEEVHVTHLHAHWATGPATCAMVVSKMLGIPFSFTAHAYDVWREQLLLPEKIGAAAFAVTCTEYNRQHLVSTYGAPLKRICTVHHGVDVKCFGGVERTANEEPVIVSVGRLVEQKGFERLLRACRLLADRKERFRCEIVGDGPLRVRLEALIAEYDLASRVALLGRLYQDELRQRYAAADLFALFCVPASDDDRDGIPNVMIEAMATGLPVVSTRFSGIPELVVDGETGRLVAVDDETADAEALRSLLGDPELRRRMGSAGRRRVLDGFTTEASAAKLDTVFSRLAR